MWEQKLGSPGHQALLEHSLGINNWKLITFNLFCRRTSILAPGKFVDPSIHPSLGLLPSLPSSLPPSLCLFVPLSVCPSLCLSIHSWLFWLPGNARALFACLPFSSFGWPDQSSPRRTPPLTRRTNQPHQFILN